MKRLGPFLLLIAAVFLVPPALAGGSVLPDVGALTSHVLVGAIPHAIQDSKPANVDVDAKIEVGDKDNSQLVVSPVWLAIGGLAVLFVIVLVVMAARGRSEGATIVHD